MAIYLIPLLCRLPLLDHKKEMNRLGISLSPPSFLTISTSFSSYLSPFTDEAKTFCYRIVQGKSSLSAFPSFTACQMMKMFTTHDDELLIFSFGLQRKVREGEGERALRRKPLSFRIGLQIICTHISRKPLNEADA
jgi:hypothetical protein